MNFAKDKYGNVIKKTGIPKAADTASKYLIDIGRDFTAKQLGAKFGQLKKLEKNIGMDATEELMDYSLKSKLALSPVLFPFPLRDLPAGGEVPKEEVPDAKT